jgi:hypothetical protein
MQIQPLWRLPAGSSQPYRHCLGAGRYRQGADQWRQMTDHLRPKRPNHLPNQDAITRLIGAPCSNRTTNGRGQRGYMRLETVARWPPKHDRIVRLDRNDCNLAVGLHRRAGWPQTIAGAQECEPRVLGKGRWSPNLLVDGIYAWRSLRPCGTAIVLYSLLRHSQIKTVSRLPGRSRY